MTSTYLFALVGFPVLSFWRIWRSVVHIQPDVAPIMQSFERIEEHLALELPGHFPNASQKDILVADEMEREDMRCLLVVIILVSIGGF